MARGGEALTEFKAEYINLVLDLPDEPNLIYIGQLLDKSIKPTNLSLVKLLKLTQLNLLIMSPETSVGAAIGVHSNSELGQLSVGDNGNLGPQGSKVEIEI